jgi:hypothetical protein
MGADLYIEQIHKPLVEKYAPLLQAAVRRRDSLPRDSKEREQAQAEVEKYDELLYSDGYFRDSYNVTSVLWRLGLSWWQDVQPMCTRAGFLRSERLRRFREMVANAELRPATREELEEHEATVEETGENSVEEWHKYYVERRQKLVTFLDQAIALRARILCSL